MNALLRAASSRSRLIACLLGVGAVAVVGAAGLEDARSWFLRKSPADREKLREALRRFDLNLNADQQRAVREIDARLRALPAEDREEYLLVLRRYHNWYTQLPERERDGLSITTPEERLGRIRELAAKYPPPHEASGGASLDFMQIGGTGLFELATLYKVWLALPPAERARIDSQSEGRRVELLKKAVALKIPKELRPADYDEARWIAEAERRVSEMGGPSGPARDWLSRIQAKFEQADANSPDVDPRPSRFLRRLAVNLYVQEHHQEHPVDPVRLSQFYAATPPWIQSTFGSFSGDEVRRRLSTLYRILFPYPEEFRGVGALRPSAPAPAAARVQSTGPAPAPAPKSTNQTPF